MQGDCEAGVFGGQTVVKRNKCKVCLAPLMKKRKTCCSRKCLAQYQKFDINSQKLSALYRAGSTIDEIALKFKCSRSVIHRTLIKNGVQRRPFGKRDQWGRKNPAWKGSMAGYRPLHRRVDRRLGKPKRCDVCGKTAKSMRYEWANLTGRFHDVSDYKRMCKRCHVNFDMNRRKK